MVRGLVVVAVLGVGAALGMLVPRSGPQCPAQTVVVSPAELHNYPGVDWVVVPRAMVLEARGLRRP